MPRRKPASLTKLESEIMDAIWNSESDSVSVRQILQRLNRGRKQKLAYTTVQTVVVILREKNILKQVPSSDRAHRFKPTVTRMEVCRNSLSDLAQRLFRGKFKPLIHRLIDDADLSTEELNELRDLVDSKLSGDRNATR